MHPTASPDKRKHHRSSLEVTNPHRCLYQQFNCKDSICDSICFSFQPQVYFSKIPFEIIQNNSEFGPGTRNQILLDPGPETAFHSFKFWRAKTQRIAISPDHILTHGISLNAATECINQEVLWSWQFLQKAISEVLIKHLWEYHLWPINEDNLSLFDIEPLGSPIFTMNG